MVKFQEAMKDQGLAVICLHSPVTGDKKLASLGASVGEFRMPFPVLLADEATQEAYGITGIPTRVLVDREGRIVFREVGFSEDMAPELERRIREALQ